MGNNPSFKFAVDRGVKQWCVVVARLHDSDASLCAVKLLPTYSDPNWVPKECELFEEESHGRAGI